MRKKKASQFILNIKILFIIVVIIFLFGYNLFVSLYNKLKRNVPVKQRLAILKDLFGYVADSAEQNNIKLCLMFGTLLGQQRQNDLICYDYDVDVAVLSNTDFMFLANDLTKRINSDPQSPYAIIIVDNFLFKHITILHKKSKINLDIDVYSKTKNGSFQLGLSYFVFLYSKYIANQTQRRTVPQDWFLPLKPVRFLGKNVYIPNKPELYLETEYGKNYLTPNHSCNADCSKCVKV